MARTKYQILQKKKTSHCAGRIDKKTLNAAKDAYIKDAVKKGQTKSQATAKANRVINGKCSTASVSGTKKKKSRKKTTRRKKR